MIYVDRKKIPKPEFWDGPEFRSFLDEWAHFHGVEGGTRGTQKRASSGAGEGLEHFKRLALPTLLEAFHHKCAYTEEKIDEKSGVVVLHRPEADAMGLGSEISPQHYWWLVGDWSNWYPASKRLASVKHRQFPVAGTRSPVPAKGGRALPSDRWIKENCDLGVLLDPCRDQSAWHLEFRADGTVHPRAHPSRSVQQQFGLRARGEVSIAVLSLNDSTLVQKRIGSYRSMAAPLNELLFGEMIWQEVEDLLAVDLSFLALRRQATARAVLPIVDFTGEMVELDRVIEHLSEELAAEIATEGAPWPSSPVSFDVWAPLRPIFAREWPELDDEGFKALMEGRRVDDEVEAEALSLAVPSDSEADTEPVIDRSARVEHVEITNFKAIESLSLPLSTEPVTLPAPYEPWGTGDVEIPSASRWVAFLGENGSGKSTCLQALGLALAGGALDDLLDLPGLEWKVLLRRGASRGRICVRFTGGARIDLRFTANTHWWIGDDGKKLAKPPRMAAYVRGYGATRLLEGGPVDGAAETVRLQNLYDPKAQVLDAEAWLLDLDEGDFNVAAVTLAGFLENGERKTPRQATSTAFRFMTREDGEVLVAGEPLFHLSDGYRAVITLVCDVMAGLGSDFSDLRNATGMVLIDELGAHLHPRWRMEITTRLRREFPQVQFFVSTHEPLCLRGLYGGEVIRVHKTAPPGDVETPFPPGVVETEVIERSPSDYRVDQLLTSEFFGLATTIDPDLDRRFQAYYRLLAMDPQERAEAGLDDMLAELRREVEEHGEPVLGFTRRDQLVYEAIDEFLSEERKLSPVQRRQRREETLAKVQDIWRGRRALGLGGRRRGSGG